MKFFDRMREEVRNHTAMGFVFWVVVLCPTMVIVWALIGWLEGKC
jgi:hypothetical protein